MAEALIILRIILDLLSIFLAFIPLIILKAGVNPYQRGFFCDDTSIRYPFKGSTIPGLYLEIASCILPPLIFLVVEVVRWKRRQDLSKMGPWIYFKGRAIPRVLISFYSITTVYFFGLGIEQSVTNIGKYSIGRLRPHFIDVVQPNQSAFDCKDEYGQYRYILDTDIFQGSDAHRMKEARLSFPSGHASMATYSALFTIIYLHARVTWRCSQLLSHMIQAALGFTSLYICLSRVSDYKHHWSDVLAGAVVGTSVAALVAVHLSDLFKKNRMKFLLQQLNIANNNGTCNDNTSRSTPVQFNKDDLPAHTVELSAPSVDTAIKPSNKAVSSTRTCTPAYNDNRASSGSFYDNRDVRTDYTDYPTNTRGPNTNAKSQFL